MEAPFDGLLVGLIRYSHCKLIKLTFFEPFTKKGVFKLTKCGLSPKGLCILNSVIRVMVKTYNCSCNRNMYLWGNLVAFDWNDLPVGREFWLLLTGIICPWAGN